MAACHNVTRPVARSLRQDALVRPLTLAAHRSFSQSVARRAENLTSTTQPKSAPPPPSSTSPSSGPGAAAGTKEPLKPTGYVSKDPNTVTNPWYELKLVAKGTPPVGSRRRRAAIKTSQNVPFEQLPYQAFQEARKILQEDRNEKLAAIAAELAKIKRLEQTPAEQLPGGEAKKTMRLTSMRKHVESLKILADVNDPVVKRRFEDGLGDMNKPIYRYYAERKWRGYPFRLISQRISQFYIVPDILPKFEPTVDVQMHFRQKRVDPGEIIDSRVSEVAPRLRVQVFDSGERMMSVVVMDSDVPNPETDTFDRRLHYLAANVPISPSETSLPLSKVNKETQLAVPWLPAFSQKGAPYHRLSVFVLQQKPGEIVDVAKLRELYLEGGRDGFSLKSYRDKFNLTPVGFNIFRTVWDEGTAGVMERAGVPGADIEFKLKRVQSLKPERKARGWEAKRMKPKYKTLWKYTHRIRGQPRYRG